MHDEYLNTNFIGKTVKNVKMALDNIGLCKDLFIEFMDGTQSQLGAVENRLVCVTMSNDQAERQAGNATQPENSATDSPKTVNPQAGGQFAPAPCSAFPSSKY